jgi:hypothetical protein
MDCAGKRQWVETTETVTATWRHYPETPDLQIHLHHKPSWPVGPSDEGEIEMASVLTNPDELPRQNRKKLDETAGQRLAATGIAAAFAASVAMLGCPVGGALAAATQVDVVNPATSPALTRSVDDPGRIAYQSTTTCVQDSAVKNTCFFDFPAVPKTIGSLSSMFLPS